MRHVFFECEGQHAQNDPRSKINIAPEMISKFDAARPFYSILLRVDHDYARAPMPISDSICFRRRTSRAEKSIVGVIPPGATRCATSARSGSLFFLTQPPAVAYASSSNTTADDNRQRPQKQGLFSPSPLLHHRSSAAAAGFLFVIVFDFVESPPPAILAGAGLVTVALSRLRGAQHEVSSSRAAAAT